ncbi:MAG: ACT domain-containing protein [Candidatus Latescibacteria bacterium]|jgi:uncharacterized protein|nr:ACT domain-containing protein [Candidatus Latescibacterota bacterium]
MRQLELTVLPEKFHICRFAPDAPIPSKIGDLPFWSITKTRDELSVVLPDYAAPKDQLTEAGWRALMVVGPLDFSLTGILASLAQPLADADISIFAISTFDTDYILVKDDHLNTAAGILRKNGHRI